MYPQRRHRAPLYPTKRPTVVPPHSELHKTSKGPSRGCCLACGIRLIVLVLHQGTTSAPRGRAQSGTEIDSALTITFPDYFSGSYPCQQLRCVMGPKEFAFIGTGIHRDWYTTCADEHECDYNVRCKCRDAYTSFLAEINKHLLPSMRVLVEDILEKHPSVTSFLIGPFSLCSVYLCCMTDWLKSYLGTQSLTINIFLRLLPETISGMYGETDTNTEYTRTGRVSTP